MYQLDGDELHDHNKCEANTDTWLCVRRRDLRLYRRAGLQGLEFWRLLFSSWVLRFEPICLLGYSGMVRDRFDFFPMLVKPR